MQYGFSAFKFSENIFCTVYPVHLMLLVPTTFIASLPQQSPFLFIKPEIIICFWNIFACELC